jgi:hypothetical protein
MTPLARCSVVGLLAVLVSLISAGCGYKPARTTLPGGHTSVRVKLPNPGRVGEPDLPRMIVVELCRRLTRAGIRASSSGAADTDLTARILGLEGLAPVIAGGRTSAKRLRLKLELRLVDSGGATLWRSGLVEVEQLWALSPEGAAVSEVSRRRTLADLAARAARDGVERLLLGQ